MKEAFDLVNSIAKELGWKPLSQQRKQQRYKTRKAIVNISNYPDRTTNEDDTHYKIRLMQFYLDNRIINIKRAEKYAEKIMK